MRSWSSIPALLLCALLSLSVMAIQSCLSGCRATRRLVFALSRFMGTSIAMIDLHYGHLAVDSHEHAVSLLDALALERAVDAGWTSARRPAKPHHDTVSRPRRSHSRRAVDARWTSRPETVATRANR